MNRRFKTREMTYMALFAVLLTVCAWIAIPFTVPVTLQTFGVFSALFILGGRGGLVSVLVYIALGAVGLPVFTGFMGGIGVLAGPTGGYITGFCVMALVYWAITAKFGNGRSARIAAAAAGLVLCYAFGTAWYLAAYAAGGGMKLGGVLLICVVPYIVPDVIKLVLAELICSKVKKFIKI